MELNTHNILMALLLGAILPSLTLAAQSEKPVDGQKATNAAKGFYMVGMKPDTRVQQTAPLSFTGMHRKSTNIRVFKEETKKK